MPICRCILFVGRNLGRGLRLRNDRNLGKIWAQISERGLDSGDDGMRAWYGVELDHSCISSKQAPDICSGWMTRAS